MEEAHSAEYGGHSSSDKTYDKIWAQYYWNNMYKDVVQFVSNCSICKSRKLKKVRYPLQDMLFPEYPFQIIGIDTLANRLSNLNTIIKLFLLKTHLFKHVIN